MHKLIVAGTALFFLFIVWVIFQANLGNGNIFMDIVRAVPYGDKVGHFFLFGILSFLAVLSTKFKGLRIGKQKLYWAIVVVILVVALEELSQGFIPTRSLSVSDFIADLAGILTAYCLCLALEKRKAKSEKRLISC